MNHLSLQAIEIKPISVTAITVVALLAMAHCADATSVDHDSFMRTNLVIGEESDNSQVLLTNVTNLVVNSDGHIFFYDIGSSCIYKLNSDGTLIGKLGTPGEGPADLMFAPYMSIDSLDTITYAGVGGIVQTVDPDWNYRGSFDRINPGERARSVSVSSDGHICICATNVLEQTTIDLYSPNWEHKRSFAKTYAADQDIDWRLEALYAGGVSRFDHDGTVLYLQNTPYVLCRYDIDGNLLNSTVKGGGTLVEPPPETLQTGDTMTVSFNSGSTGLEVLTDGRIVTSCFSRQEDGTVSMLCLYSASMKLLSAVQMPGSHVVVGCDREDNVFVFDQDGDVPVITRNSIIQ